MFGQKHNRNRPTIAVDTLIGPKTTIVGDLRFSGGLHIDGSVQGSVLAEPDTEAMLILSERGRIDGQVRAPHVVINGQLHGDIVASERVELAAQARVTGNIHYKLLDMSAGAQVCGQVTREEEPIKLLTGPVLVEG